MYNNKHTNKYINLKKKYINKENINKSNQNINESKENIDESKDNLNSFDIEKINYTFFKNFIIYIHVMYMFLLFISNLFYILTKKILFN